MKIALAHKRFELRGGTERVLYRTAEGLRDRGHEVHLFCHKFPTDPPPGVWVHRVPGLSRPRSLRALTFAFIAPRAIAKHGCDVVMSFDRILGQDLFRSGGGPRKLLLRKLKNQAGWLRKLWYSVSVYHHLTVVLEALQVKKNRSGKIIAICEQVKREFLQIYDIAEDQVVVIHNGVDAVRFNPQRRANEGKNLRNALGIPADDKVVLFVGTGFRRKGLGRILGLWERQELPGVRLLVVGNDSRLARYRRRWRQNGSVIFAGPQKQVENYYACADLLVLPAVQEAFGNVVLEAMASGLPVVASAEVGAMNDMVGPLAEGIVADPDDPVEVKAKILTMLDHKRWSLCARAARQRAEQFTWENYFDRLEHLLFDCRRHGTISPFPSRPNA